MSRIPPLVLSQFGKRRTVSRVTAVQSNVLRNSATADCLFSKNKNKPCKIYLNMLGNVLHSVPLLHLFRHSGRFGFKVYRKEKTYREHLPPASTFLLLLKVNTHMIYNIHQVVSHIFGILNCVTLNTSCVRQRVRMKCNGGWV